MAYKISPVDLFSRKFSDLNDDLKDFRIDKNKVIALYFTHGDGSTDKPFNVLMICEDYFCVDKCFDLTLDAWLSDNLSSERGGTVIYWENLIHVYRYDYSDLPYDKSWKQYYTCFKFNDRSDELGIKVYEPNLWVIKNLLVPMFSKLKDIDVME